jgi:3-oxoacyl-[acyl-carrier protein] reductase
MNLDLKGKRAIVCGSTQGIGKASAIELASLGADITLMARNEEKLQDVLAELPFSGEQQHDYVVADFTKAETVEHAILNYTANHEVHILVNNTGGPPAGLAIDADVKDFLRAYESHLVCNHILVKAVVDGMKKSRYGRIINIISTSVKIPIYGLGVSNTTRGAVASWSKTLSLELAQFGITVNNVLPGATLTGRLKSIIDNKSAKSGKSKAEIEAEMVAEIPARRICSPEEVAAAVAFLASPAAGYINGVNIPVDGGRTGSL